MFSRRVFRNSKNDDDDSDGSDEKPTARSTGVKVDDTPLIEAEKADYEAEEGTQEETTAVTDATIEEVNSSIQSNILLGIEVLRGIGVLIGIIVGLFGTKTIYYRAATSLYVFSVSGLNAVENLLLSKMVARANKWPTGSPYQIQSGLNDLGNTVTMIVLLSVRAVDGSLATLMVSVTGCIALNGMLDIYSFVKDKLSGRPGSLYQVGKFAASLLILLAVIEILHDWSPFPGFHGSIAPSSAPSWYRREEIEEFWTIDAF